MFCLGRFSSKKDENVAELWPLVQAAITEDEKAEKRKAEGNSSLSSVYLDLNT